MNASFPFIPGFLFHIMHACTNRACNLRQGDPRRRLGTGTPAPVGTLLLLRASVPWLPHTLFQQNKGKITPSPPPPASLASPMPVPLEPLPPRPSTRPRPPTPLLSKPLSPSPPANSTQMTAPPQRGLPPLPSAPSLHCFPHSAHVSLRHDCGLPGWRQAGWGAGRSSSTHVPATGFGKEGKRGSLILPQTTAIPSIPVLGHTHDD